jgi:hypothetical protein
MSWNSTALSRKGGTPRTEISFNPATNQIDTTGYAYDAVGDIAIDGFHSYTYDAGGNRTARNVSERIGDVRNNDGELLEEISHRKLFATNSQ